MDEALCMDLDILYLFPARRVRAAAANSGEYKDAPL